MRKRYIDILLCLGMGIAAQAQTTPAENLVYNPSFEEHTICPKKIESLGVLTIVDAWYQPTAGSADYFNRCGSRECGVPSNKIGIQEPHSGDGYCGIYCSKDNYREYLQTELKQPLKKGKTYRLRFYASLSEYSSASIATLGGLLSVERITDTTRGILMRRSRSNMSNNITQTLSSFYSPQVENPPERKIDDPQAWQLIEGTFIATGGESFLTIGNFNSAAHSNISYPDTLTYLLPGAYYYIDDISLECLDCGTDIDMKQDSTEKENENRYHVGSTILLKNIYFEFDKSTILQQSYKELVGLLDLLNTHTSMRIEIGGHTDNQGSKKYNERLSEKRAKAIADFLIGKGIDKKRIEYKGYGETKPIDNNDTEEGRSNNRRVEFKIIRM